MARHSATRSLRRRAVFDIPTLYTFSTLEPGHTLVGVAAIPCLRNLVWWTEWRHATAIVSELDTVRVAFKVSVIADAIVVCIDTIAPLVYVSVAVVIDLISTNFIHWLTLRLTLTRSGDR